MERTYEPVILEIAQPEINKKQTSTVQEVELDISYSCGRCPPDTTNDGGF